MTRNTTSSADPAMTSNVLRVANSAFYGAQRRIGSVRDALVELGRDVLAGCTLYTSTESCAMCAGALVNSRVDAVVFGAWDLRAGAVESLFRICDDPRLNHRLEVVGGVSADACAARLKDFFARLRSGEAIPKPRPR
mgnify:CR=1 FL=1